jgi:methylglutaconyl-CoA hydratase
MKWLELTKINSVYNMTLNRPDVRNAFNPEVICEITQAFKNIPTGVRVIILRGHGKVFCSGADLEWMRSMVNYTLAENQRDSLELYEMFKVMRDCALPIITVVQGAAMGGALGLMACSDVVLAESTTQFCFSEVRLGLAPAVISRFILEKSTLAQVNPWMISGKVFGVSEAKTMGLVQQFGTKDEIEVYLKEWAQSFLDAAPGAVSETKKLLQGLAIQSEDDQLERTTSLIAARRVSTEGQEGLKSFLEKRQPAWKEVWK